MKNNKTSRKKWTRFAILTASILAMPFISMSHVSAERGVAFTVSPMKEKMVLNPGDEYSSTINLSIPVGFENDIKYTVEVAPFFVDESYNNDFNNTYGTINEIVKWISIDTPKEGRLSPGQSTTIIYSVDVPEDAAGGGQYAAVLVTAKEWSEGYEDNSNDENGKVKASLTEEKKIACRIFTEITGDITRQGEIVDINVPSFLLSGNVTGSAAIKNIGNIHGNASYRLQVFPLFSDEEIYTNEEDPDEKTILPDRTLYNETAWEQTPSIGIFNVIYTVEFEGVTTQVSKLVIKCPVWLLFIIFAIIAGIIIWIIMRIRARGKSGEKLEKKAEE